MGGSTAVIAGSRELARLILGGVFVYAGMVKALDPFHFSVDIQNYRLVPVFAASLLALYLPWLEIVCGGALIFKKWQPGALVVLLILMGIFIVALGQAWTRGLDVTCGCFGHPEAGRSYLEWILRDLGIGIALGWLLLAERPGLAGSTGGAEGGGCR